MRDENVTYLFPIKNGACKPLFKVKEIREELAAYFLNRGGVKWQNDCV
jgi:hypothetical protein